MIQDRYSSLLMVTPLTIRNTVMCDERSCLWFRKLVAQSKVVGRIKSSSEGSRSYKHYQWFSLAANLLLILSVSLCLAGIFLFPGLFMLFSVLGAASAALAVVGILKTRQALSEIAGCLIGLDSADLPAGVTFYQLGEIYARKYGVPSLVEVIWLWDQRMRDAFLVLFFIPFGVLFLSVWKVFAWLMVGTFLMACLVKIMVLARKSF